MDIQTKYRVLNTLNDCHNSLNDILIGQQSDIMTSTEQKLIVDFTKEIFELIHRIERN